MDIKILKRRFHRVFTTMETIGCSFPVIQKMPAYVRKMQRIAQPGLIGLLFIALFAALQTFTAKPGLPQPPQPPLGNMSPVQPASQPAAEAKPAVKTHIVAEGETLGTIAEKYYIDTDTILGANPDAGETLHPGDKLVILPQKGILYTAARGDTLWRIASVFGVDVQAVLKANGKTADELDIGEKLFVPGGKLLARSESAIPVSRAAVNRFSWPTQGEISSPFGRRWGRMHEGVDIANDWGESVTAAMAGRVTYTGWYSGYGNTIMIEHTDGYVTLYGHLSAISVGTGQYVQAGQRIGSVGSTGESTGPHLHFEVRKDGTPINPLNVLP